MTTIDYVAGNDAIIVLVKPVGDEYALEVCDAKTGQTMLKDIKTPAPKALAHELLKAATYA